MMTAMAGNAFGATATFCVLEASVASATVCACAAAAASVSHAATAASRARPMSMRALLGVTEGDGIVTEQLARLGELRVVVERDVARGAAVDAQRVGVHGELVGQYALAVDDTARRRQIARRRELDRRTHADRHDGLHRAL